MQQVKAQNVGGDKPPVLPVIQGSWYDGGWRIVPLGPNRREYVVGCWIKCNAENALNDGSNNFPCNFAITDYDQGLPAGYYSLRTYFYDEYTQMRILCDNYGSGGQKSFVVNPPYIDGMGGIDTHWVHLMARVGANNSAAEWYVNGKYIGHNTYTDTPTYTVQIAGLVQSIFGRRYGGVQHSPQCFRGSVYNWFCADDVDYRTKFGFSYDNPEEYVTPWVRNNGGNMLVPVTDEDMPSRADAMANMYLGCHLTAYSGGVIQVNGDNSGQTWFSNESWSMTGKSTLEMPVFGYDMRT